MEAPRFEEAKWQEYRKQGVQVLAVSVVPRGDAVEKAKAFAEKYHWTFPVLLDKATTTWTSFGGPGVPRNVLIGRDGKLAYNHTIGAKATAQYEALHKAVDEALKVK